MQMPYDKSEIAEKILCALVDEGLDSLMSLLYSIFESPILIADINTRVVYQYPLKVIGDEAYDRLLREKKLDDAIIEQHLCNHNHGVYDEWDPFYADTGKCEAYPRLYGIISRYGVKQATLAVFIGKKRIDGDLCIIKMFTDALRIKFERDLNSNQNHISQTARCLHDILNTSSSPYLINSAERTLSQRLLGNFIIIVTPIGNDVSQKNFSSHIVGDAMTIYRNLVSVIYDNNIVILVGEIGAGKFCAEKNRCTRELTDKFCKNGLVSGISMKFSSMSTIPGHYRQALLAARLGSRYLDRSYVRSDEVLSRLVFRSMIDSHENLCPDIYLHPVLNEMKAYDAVYNTDYFQTVRAYCINFFDRDQAAISISVHRNTLVYRINRVQDIFHIDLEDPALRKDLYCSFLLDNEIVNS